MRHCPGIKEAELLESETCPNKGSRYGDKFAGLKGTKDPLGESGTTKAVQG